MRAAKELHFNKNMEALKKMQAGADKLATVVGVTLGPKVRPCLQRACPVYTCRSRRTSVTSSQPADICSDATSKCRSMNMLKCP